MSGRFSLLRMGSASLSLAVLSVAADLSMPMAAFAHDASNAVQSPRRTYNLNSGWLSLSGDQAGAETVRLDDSGWRQVTLPNAFNESEAFARDIKQLSTGITWYRKRFTLPRNATRSKALLEFEGVRQAAEIWVNGKSVVTSENGISAFGADITAALQPGENVIAVRVDNDWKYKERATGSGFQWNNDNFNVNYGGITRNVRLHLTGTVYQTLPLYSTLGTTGQYVWADGFDLKARSATVHAETQIRNESDKPRHLAVEVEIRDPQGVRVARFTGADSLIAPGATAMLSAAAPIDNLHFWSWGYGYLYTVTTSLVERGKRIDSVDTKTGFRQTQFGNGMIKLNGRVIQVHGYAQRTSNEWPAVGVSIPPWISDFSNALMVESGGNLVRWMHITPSKQDIESADRVGLIQAMPAGDAESDTSGRRWEQRKEVMRDAIIYNRNNPSILFYEGGNENISEDHMAELKAIRDEYDPNGGRAIGSREMLDSTKAEYGGEMLYINKSAKHPMWAMEYSRDEAARAYQDAFSPPFHKDAPDYNRNQDSHAIEDVKRWNDFYVARPGTGTRVSSGGVNIIFSDSNSHFRGDNNYRRSGEVDAVRLPKEGFFAHKVMWSDWVDSVTPASHIIGHWNYAPGTIKDVAVVSNGKAVELFLNGRSLGKGENSDNFLFRWKNVAFEPGTLRAVATHADGRTSEYRLETTGPAVGLKLSPHLSPRGFVMDGADIALVDVEAVDAKGRRVPIDNRMLRFTLDGPAQWRGGIAQGDSSGKERAGQTIGEAVVLKAHAADGTTSYAGTARDEDNFILSQSLPLENGVNRILLRAGMKAGAIALTVKAEGLPPARLSIAGKAVKPGMGGLSTDFPEQYQPGSLVRGPTPEGASFQLHRTTHRPQAVKAASRQTDTAQTLDDNELTHWASDGQSGNAWIEYRFAQPVELNAVDLKLVGWRSRAYPLEISMDGKRVWQGTTQRSLGYVTLDFPATTGQVLRIRQTGPVADRDAFGKVVELNNAKASGDTGADLVPPGWHLAIVEAEFHGPAR